MAMKCMIKKKRMMVIKMNTLMTISNEIANQPARVRSPLGRLCIMKRKWSMDIVDSLSLFIDI